MKLWRKTVLVTAALLVAAVCAALIINAAVAAQGKKHIVDAGSFSGAHTAIVPGAYVLPDGRLCDMLADRVETAVELYRQGKVEKILMTGDHGRTSYDEVNSMRKYAQSRGIPAGDIFMDHAGFSTYESMYRAREIFGVQSAVVVTQNFHLPRAVYTARKLGLPAVGISSDRYNYPTEMNEIREVLARVKAFAQVVAKTRPTFLGEAIPITGDGRATHDIPD